jgi:hypothetical protein
MPPEAVSAFPVLEKRSNKERRAWFLLRKRLFPGLK